MRVCVWGGFEAVGVLARVQYFGYFLRSIPLGIFTKCNIFPFLILSSLYAKVSNSTRHFHEMM